MSTWVAVTWASVPAPVTDLVLVAACKCLTKRARSVSTWVAVLAVTWVLVLVLVVVLVTWAVPVVLAVLVTGISMTTASTPTWWASSLLLMTRSRGSSFQSTQRWVERRKGTDRFSVSRRLIRTVA